MSSLVLKAAADVIRRANRANPADTVLRNALRLMRDLSALDTEDISGAVFAYYRWRGWSENVKVLEVRIDRAREFADRFRRNSHLVPIAELRSKAVPDWTATEVRADDEWFRSLQREPRLWLRAKRGQGNALAKKLGHCKAFGTGSLADCLEYSGTQDLFRTTEFHHGDFELQDLSSQAVGLICDPKPGETWWDACAGEGGKLLHLSELMENKGLIWVSDRAAWRLQKLKRRAARARVFNYRAVAWQGETKLPTKTKFDGVLLDAPCSGVGTWQRNPHARWTTKLSDVKELSEIQTRLLVNAAASVKPGGKLVYAVCTITQSETTRVADAFESAIKDFEPLPVANPLTSDQATSARMQLWPQDFGGNGMFFATWKRKG